MHFKTLVTVNMPTVEEDPHENAVVVQSMHFTHDGRGLWSLNRNAA